MIREDRNPALGGHQQSRFGGRYHLGYSHYVVRAGKNMSARQAVFLKLTTAPIAIFMTRLNLSAIDSDRQSLLKASFWHGHIVDRENKQKERNELDPTIHYD
jgi:hypothetical protein